MANNIAELSISLTADSASLSRGLQQANQQTQQAAEQMSHSVQSNVRDARGALMLMGEDFGIHIPREIRTSLAEMEIFGNIASAALAPVLLIGFAKVITESVIPAIQHAAEELAGWGKEEQEAYKEQVAFNKELAETVKKTQDLNFENSLIGKSAEEQAKMRAQHAAEEKQTAQQRLTSAIANLQRIRKEEADAAAAAVPEVSPYAADLAASTYTDVSSALSDTTKKSKELIEAENAVSKAQADVSYQTAVTTGKTKEYGVALKEAADQAAKAAQTHQQELAAALASVASIGARIAKDNGDILGEITSRSDAEFAKVRAIALKYPELWAQTLDTELKIRLAKRQAISDAEIKALTDANKAVADLVKAGEAGIAASLNLGPTPGLPAFVHNPLQEQIDALSGNSMQAGIERGKIMDDMWVQLQTHSQQYTFQIQKLDAAFAGSKISTEYVRALQSVKEQFDVNTIAVTNFASAAGSAFQQAIFHTHDFKSAVESLLESLAELVAQLALANEVESLIAAGGSSKTFGGFLGSLIGLGHAAGGPVSAGMAYPVGEQGPELFMPETNGYILPNAALSHMSGGMSVVYQIDARGADASVEQRVMRAIRASHDHAVTQAKADLYDAAKRR
jgi:hypothetical protein